MLPIPRKDDGFTLVEVLAAVVILAIGLMAIITACQAGRETQRRAVYMAVGRNLAQSKVEEMRATDFEHMADLAGASVSSSLPAGNSVTVAVYKYPDASSNQLCRVTVQVRWPEGNGIREVNYETLIAKTK